MSAILDSVKIQNKTEIMRELDKISKIGEDTVKGNLRKYANTNQILTLFKMLEKPLAFFVKNVFDGAEDVKKLQDLGKLYGFSVRFNPFMVRGLSYYTGNIFEIKVQGKKDSIAAGGRYDKTVGKYLGREIPAVGISFGLDRLTKLVDDKDIKIEKTKAVLISLEQDTETIKLAQRLRKAGVSCTINFGKPGKGLEYANSLEIPYAIFIGSQEVAVKKLKLKDMKSGDEKLLSEKQLINKLKK